MCKNLTFSACLVLAVSTVGSVRAAAIFHWTFDGTPDANIVQDTDIVSGAKAYGFIDDDGVGTAVGLFYGQSNPWFRTTGTGADFQNDPTTNDRGYGLAVLDTGINSPVDLSTLSQVTIECFVQPYLARQSIVIRKNNSPDDGGIYYIDTRPVGHSYSGKGTFAVRLVGDEEDTGDQNSICHDLPYTTDEWHHVALVWDGSFMKFYVNGQQSQELGTRSDRGYEPNTGVSEVPFTGPIGDSCKALGIGCQDRDCMTDPGNPTNTGQMFCGKIDEVRISDEALDPSRFLLYGLPELAKKPNPSNLAENLCPPGLSLCWTAGIFAAEHDVYFGTDFDSVKDADTTVTLGVYKDRWPLDANCYEPSGVELGKTYYWRIDEVNNLNMWKGDVWQLTTNDGNAFAPEPANEQTKIPITGTTLSWTAGCEATSHDVYFGTDPDVLQFQTNVGTPQWDTPNDLDYSKWYYWRIDERKDGVQTWKGPVWSFLSEAATELLVPDQFPTIQEAINVAAGTDIISVAPGVYQEEIDFLGKAITVQGFPAAAIIDGGGGFAVCFLSGEGPDSVLQNFVIRNSYTGIFLADTSPKVRNVTVWGNQYGVAGSVGAHPDITNSIFWNNTQYDIMLSWACYSCIQDGGEGLGNITHDPLFVDPVNGDYHLKSQAGRWNPDTQSWVGDDVTSPCIDAGNPGSPPGEESSDPNNLRTNMGAYGGTAQASKSPANWKLLADLNNDDIVNTKDYATQARDWTQSQNEQPGDLNRDGTINNSDLGLLVADWLKLADRR